MDTQSVTFYDADFSKFLTHRYLDKIFSGNFPEPHAIADQIAKVYQIPPLGAHLATPRIGYTHHGIYVGNKKVIHYSGFAKGLEGGPVDEIELNEFSQKKPFRVERHPNAIFSPIQVVERARSRIKENNYNLVFNNCEHFTHWCINNIQSSDQVNTFSKTVAMTATKTFSKANLAVNTAIVVNDVRKSLLAFIKGDIDKKKLYEDIGHSAITTTSMTYYGALGQAAIPIPAVGFLLGASIGYFFGNVLQKSGLLAIGDAPAVAEAKKRSREVEQLSNQLIHEIRKSRNQLESYLNKYFQGRKEVFQGAFMELDDAFLQWDSNKVGPALEKINLQFGKTLQFKEFNDFEAMMLSNRELNF